MQNLERITDLLEEVERNCDPKTLKKLHLILTKRVATRLDEYSESCETCEKMLSELETNLQGYVDAFQSNESVNILEHRNIRKSFIDHLTKIHKLLQDDHFVSTYMALGISLGLIFGMVLFDNLAMGMMLGLVLGIAIGSGKDADAKKKGKTI